jgi:DNA polymerase III delta prime subunit
MHHAYLLVGDKETAHSFVVGRLEEVGFVLANNPDYLVLRFETFGIPEARDLSQRAARKAFSGRKVFLIVADALTHEAQNALLKTFEEPTSDTHFFVVVREEGMVIPTLLSRMQVVKLEASSEKLEDAKDFLMLPLKKRLEFAKDFEGNLAQFLDELLLITKSKEVLALRRYAQDRSASARLILEHLALVSG